jgi:hypothetical protein
MFQTFDAKIDGDKVTITNENGQSAILTKQQFDRDFVSSGNGRWEPNEAAKNKANRLEELLGQAVAKVIIASAQPSLDSMLMMGDIVDTICEEYGASPMEVIQLIQERRARFFEGAIKEGISFGDVHPIPNHLKKRNMENSERIRHEEREAHKTIEEREARRKNEEVTFLQKQEDRMSIGDIIRNKKTRKRHD